MGPVSLGLLGLRALGFLKKHRQVVAYGLLAVAILAAFGFVAHRIDRHFDSIRATESQLSVAQSEAQRLNDRVSALDVTLKANLRTHDAERQQLETARKVAEQERDAARARAARYERIRNAATESPPEDRLPVSPVVRDTIDRLWPDHAGGAGTESADHP